jgi:hypothetical protein
VVVDADVGFGALLVRHDRSDRARGRRDDGGPFEDYRGPGNIGCTDA